MASVLEKYFPPSAKELGVTFRIPITKVLLIFIGIDL
jgi:hypothetical protein